MSWGALDFTFHRLLEREKNFINRKSVEDLLYNLHLQPDAIKYALANRNSEGSFQKVEKMVSDFETIIEGLKHFEKEVIMEMPVISVGF